MADIAAAVADRYASARATGSATRATIAAQGALKRRTSADRSVRPPRRLSAPPRRSAAFAVARARRLEAPSPSDSSGSTTPSCVRHSETSFPTPSCTRSRSWISQATSGGSSSRSAFEHAVRWRSKRAASSGSSRASARVATATVASCSSRCPSAASETTTFATYTPTAILSAASLRPAPSYAASATRCAAFRKGCTRSRVSAWSALCAASSRVLAPWPIGVVAGERGVETSSARGTGTTGPAGDALPAGTLVMVLA